MRETATVMVTTDDNGEKPDNTQQKHIIRKKNRDIRYERKRHAVGAYGKSRFGLAPIFGKS